MAVLVGPSVGAENFITRRFVISPGGRIPEHRHDRIEHEQVIVRGKVLLRLDGREHVVGVGDAVFIPAGCAHSYENRGRGEAEFICVVPNTKDYETEWLEPAPPGAFAG